ncbi:MAG: NAD-dependent protein deacetylase, partial [Pseudomonadota bacterium]|nr:NAD-dependent protein deacetylase [Pseudomonadota bacterium]
VSANSGIPTYRDRTGRWLRVDPIQHKEFVESEAKRKRYWARSMVGWVGVDGARPNATHYALAELERAGKIDLLITQNVDRLHQKAGSQRVVDLHGRLDQVICLDCGEQESRKSFQTRLLRANPFVTDYQHIARPDGDADVPDTYVEKTTIPDCEHCGGVVMPDVVFFGGTVPRSRVEACTESLGSAGGLLVVGSSLNVYSGFRFCRMAEKLRIPIVIVNEGETRADEMATLKVERSAMNRLVAAIDHIIPSQESKSA